MRVHRPHVRKGEHGSTAVYADRFTKTEQNDKGEDVKQDVSFLKAYTVFSADQVERLPERFYAMLEAPAARGADRTRGGVHCSHRGTGYYQ